MFPTKTNIIIIIHKVDCIFNGIFDRNKHTWFMPDHNIKLYFIPLVSQHLDNVNNILLI